MVDLPAPEDGQNHEYAAVGCINPAEMGRLKGRHDAVKNEDNRPSMANQALLSSRIQIQMKYPPPIFLFEYASFKISIRSKIL
jgi:hypothetical protein